MASPFLVADVLVEVVVRLVDVDGAGAVLLTRRGRALEGSLRDLRDEEEAEDLATLTFQ